MKTQACCLLIIVLFLSGCSTFVVPRVTTFEPTQEKFDKAANVVISEEHLKEKEHVHFGLAGFLAPVSVRVGDTMVQHALSNFSNIFREVKLNDTSQPSPDSVTVQLETERFEVIGLSWHATLDLKMRVLNSNDKNIFEKNYHVEGSRHSMLFNNEFEQQIHVKLTTEEAFIQVFSEITDDLRHLKLDD
ncbi:MAG: hypothetical protein K8S27_15935 [Candidatus Omnitrophica bacterium]|nr:hypothetical protein [Candidatus Omnitrophota bacterium]